MHVFSDTFLNVGSIEESIDNGPRSTQHGAPSVSDGADDPWYPSLICLSVQRNLGDYHEHGNHCDKPGSKRTARDTAMEETTS